MPRSLTSAQSSGSTGLSCSDSFQLGSYEYKVLQEDRNPVFSLYAAKIDKDGFVGDDRQIGTLEINRYCGLFLRLKSASHKVNYHALMCSLINTNVSPLFSFLCDILLDHNFVEGTDGIPIPNQDHKTDPAIYAQNLDRLSALQRLIPRQKTDDYSNIKALIKALQSSGNTSGNTSGKK